LLFLILPQRSLVLTVRFWGFHGGASSPLVEAPEERRRIEELLIERILLN
jgi:hypothetical protein